jgi:hypothetical protein
MAEQQLLFGDPRKRPAKEAVAQAVQASDVRFNGSDYVPAIDDERLSGQLLRIFQAMRDGQFRTLEEIATITGDPPASISAQLRHLRKPRFGLHTVNKRSRGERKHGLYEYQLIVRKASQGTSGRGDCSFQEK